MSAEPRAPRICVVGDVLADTDLHGHAERLSPEAPVPVIDQERTIHRAGGAGLAATLAARDGADVTLVAAFADDGPGRRLRALLAAEGVRVVPVPWVGTTVEKVRVHADGRPMLRLDRGAGRVADRLPRDVDTALRDADAVLVADYGRGLAAHPQVRAALRASGSTGTPVIWDPHRRGPAPVAGATLVCPNEGEAADLTPGVGAPTPLAAAVRRGRELRERWNVVSVAVTMGAAGALVIVGDGAPLSVPVLEAAHDGDTCGAGDAFAAAAAVALGRGAVISEAVQDAVAAAACFVASGGAAGLLATRDGTADVVTQDSPAVDADADGVVVVATGGCFDILHPGHVHTLRAARRLGDRLVVLVNDDDSVRRLKGADRPVQPVEDRCAVLRSLADVDEVVVFSDDTPIEALRRLRPDVFVKGGDYTAADLPETPVVAEWGGSVVTVPFLDGRSTTRLVSRARARPHREEATDVHVG